MPIHHKTGTDVKKRKRKTPPFPAISTPLMRGVVEEVQHLEGVTSIEEETMNMSEILPKMLFLGDLGNANSLSTSNPHNIECVVTVGVGLEVNETAGITYHKIEIEDSPDAEIDAAFSSASSIIRRSLEKGKSVLVHCQRGISRSATIVIAYLMESRHFRDLETCYATVQSQRPVINPNLGFSIWLEGKYKK